jgi:DNA-binding transcriptional ArsR family regulator
MAVATRQESRARVSVGTSAIYEMMASLRRTYLAGGSSDLTEKLGAAFERDLEFFYGRFDLGAQLAELAVGFPDHHDVPGFLDHLARMSEAEFLYYSLGRYAHEEAIEDLLRTSEPTPEALSSLVESHGGALSEDHWSILEDPEGFRERLLKFWGAYWGVAEQEILGYGPSWRRAASRVSEALGREPWESVVWRLLKGKELPPQFPPGTELRDLLLVPSVCISPSYFIIWGHGSATVVFDASPTIERQGDGDARQAETNGAQGVEQIVAEARALGERNRLRILAAIHAHGRRRAVDLAEELGLSTATISRHMAVLREAGFVDEERADRGVYYRVNERRLGEASAKARAWVSARSSGA